MAKISIKNLNVFYKNIQALKNINLDVETNEILGIIGPSNSGKSSLLQVINRLSEMNNSKVTGEILLDNESIFSLPINSLRKRVGLIFATPTVLPGSIYKNVTYGPKLHKKFKKSELDELVYFALNTADLWNEVKDRLQESASKLSGGQQQRLCIARILALKPEVIMMDEPCSGLDPISTAKIESTMVSLKDKYTFILVTNNTKQAARVSSRVAFFLSGEMIEIDKTEKMFTNPKDKRTNDYISGRFG
ncbi:MAG: phosphate ABC transporter ATP-binding protein [bacterium]|nr:phosphate ABC transporter ATP-binding protein [bacterium]